MVHGNDVENILNEGKPSCMHVKNIDCNMFEEHTANFMLVCGMCSQHFYYSKYLQFKTVYNQESPQALVKSTPVF